MVLSLVNLALISITDGMKNGKIRNPQKFSPNLRQLILDTALKRGMVDDPNCLAFLTSTEFLNGMKSISIRIDNSCSYLYFQRLGESMTSALPNGGKVDAAITKLHLNRFYWKKLLEEDYVYKTVLENLIEFRCNSDIGISSYDRRGFIRDTSVVPWSGRPIINYKQLTTLKLDNCAISTDLWPEFLRKIPTLENLHMINVLPTGFCHLDKLLPFSMPHLKSLEIIPLRGYLFRRAYDFVDNLIGCTELRRVRLLLDESWTDEATLIRLASMVADRDIAMKIYARLVVNGEDAAAFDSSSKFKIVRILHERIDSIEFWPSGEWKPRYSTALEDIVTTCLNLTSFHISINETGPISGEDMKRINAAMSRFFANSERALQLTDLNLRGNFNEAVVSAVFERCLNLVQLEISACPILRDQHFIDWVDRDGGKLSKFILAECENVTSEGIIPVLVRSAEGLLHCFILMGESRSGRDWKVVLNNLCPNAHCGFS